MNLFLSAPVGLFFLILISMLGCEFMDLYTVDRKHMKWYMHRDNARLACSRKRKSFNIINLVSVKPCEEEAIRKKYFCVLLPDIWKSIALFTGSQTSQSRDSGKSSIRMNLMMEYWQNDKEGGNRTED